jgi:hypothetical protein
MIGVLIFARNASYLWCFGWVFDQLTAREVIDSIGVCGNLLGIISCVVPWTYHLSYYEDKPWKVFVWIWIPFLPLGTLITIVIVSMKCNNLAPPSMLTITSLVIVFSLTVGA